MEASESKDQACVGLCVPRDGSGLISASNCTRCFAKCLTFLHESCELGAQGGQAT